MELLFTARKKKMYVASEMHTIIFEANFNFEN